jgi:hypothetical protein
LASSKIEGRDSKAIVKLLLSWGSPTTRSIDSMADVKLSIADSVFVIIG